MCAALQELSKMASALVIIIVQDEQGQRLFRAFSAEDVARPYNRLMRDVQSREGIDEGMAIRWRHGNGYIIETHGLQCELGHANRGEFVWFALRPNGGVAHDIPPAHSEVAVAGAIAGRGQGWRVCSAAHAFIAPA